jgi:hypothetical protein
MMNWALLRVNAKSQVRYLRFVAEHYPEIEMYYPRYEKKVRPHGMGRPVRVATPVYPGYLFGRIDLDGDNIRGLTSLPVRAWFVRFGKEIEAIPDFVIEQLRDLEMAGRLVEEIVYVSPYRSGVRVKIHLPAGDLLAVIVKIKGGTRAVVELPVGRCTIPIHRLEVA